MLESTNNETESETVSVSRKWLNDVISECQAEIGGLKVQMIAMKADAGLKDLELDTAREVIESLSGRILELTKESEKDQPSE